MLNVIGKFLAHTYRFFFLRFIPSVWIWLIELNIKGDISELDTFIILCCIFIFMYNVYICVYSTRNKYFIFIIYFGFLLVGLNWRDTSTSRTIFNIILNVHFSCDISDRVFWNVFSFSFLSSLFVCLYHICKMPNAFITSAWTLFNYI